MPYRGVNQPRKNLQTTEILRQAGFTATWRQFVSASAGISVAGFGSAESFREQTITAMFGGGAMPGKIGGTVGANMQRQAALGQLIDGSLPVVTNVCMSDHDEIVWLGVRYRVDADSQPSQLNGYFMSVLVRGDS